MILTVRVVPRLTERQVRAAREAFGTTVRQLRLERKWSQEDLAEQAGLHRNYVGGIERGERNAGLDNVHRIAAALEIRPEKLFEAD